MKSRIAWLALALLVPTLLIGINVVPTYAKGNNQQEEKNFNVGGLSIHAGNSVRVEQGVVKDLVAAGNQVVVASPLFGDAFIAGNEITINAPIDGSVRVAGNTIVVNAEIEGNFVAFGNSIRIGKDAVIHGHVNAYGATVSFDGRVEQSIDARGGFVTLNGPMDGEVYVEAEELEVGAQAAAYGLVRVAGPKEPTISAQATGTEHISYEYKNFEKNAKQYKKQWWSQYFAFEFYWGIVMILLGLIVIALMPRFFGEVVARLKTKSQGKLWLTGFITLALTPMVMLALVMTIVGIPLAFVLMMLVGLLLLLSTLFVGGVIGATILKKQNVYLQFLVGYSILGVITAIPFIGWLVKLLTVIWGSGALLTTLWRKRA